MKAIYWPDWNEILVPAKKPKISSVDVNQFTPLINH